MNNHPLGFELVGNHERLRLLEELKRVVVEPVDGDPAGHTHLREWAPLKRRLLLPVDIELAGSHPFERMGPIEAARVGSRRATLCGVTPI